MTKKIPKFKNYQEEAQFWDTHDISDYLPQMKKVQVNFKKKPIKEEIITIRLQTDLKKRLKKIAKNNNISVSSLARIWLTDKLRACK